VAVLRPHPEFEGAAQKLAPGEGVLGRAVNRHVMEHDTALGLFVEAPYVERLIAGFYDDGHAVELGVPRMEDVPTHQAAVVTQ